MRKLEPPHVSDGEALRSLARSRSSNAPPVAAREGDMLARYALYSVVEGNPWAIEEDDSYLPIEKNLLHLYRNPPKALDFIQSLRDGIQGVCPVCGAHTYKAGVLDCLERLYSGRELASEPHPLEAGVP